MRMLSLPLDLPLDFRFLRYRLQFKILFKFIIPFKEEYNGLLITGRNVQCGQLIYKLLNERF